jgi:hypothetical protein
MSCHENLSPPRLCVDPPQVGNRCLHIHNSIIHSAHADANNAEQNLPFRNCQVREESKALDPRAEPTYRRGGAAAPATSCTSYNSPSSFDHYLSVSDDLTSMITACVDEEDEFLAWEERQ